MRDLAQLLRAFHDACTGEAELASGRDLVRADGVDPVARLRVYANAYWTRIAGALAQDFPKLRAHLGAEGFDALVIPYLRAHPTSHPSLREAGLHLAAFLDGRDRAADADLARLERARAEVFDGPDDPPLTRDDLAALPPEEFPLLPLRTVRASMLVELSTNADDVWDALEDERPPPAPALAGPRSVLVWRRGLAVIHRTLEADEAAALRRVHASATFGDVCEAIAASPAPAPAAAPGPGGTPGAPAPPDGGAIVERALALLLRWLDAEALAGGTMPP